MGLISDFILAFIAIVLPPLACGVKIGCNHHILVNIILTLCGWIPGIFHAWYIILRYPDGKRSEVRRHELKQQRRAAAEQRKRGQPTAIFYPPPQRQPTRYTYGY